MYERLVIFLWIRSLRDVHPLAIQVRIRYYEKLCRVTSTALLRRHDELRSLSSCTTRKYQASCIYIYRRNPAVNVRAYFLLESNNSVLNSTLQHLDKLPQVGAAEST